MADTIPINFPIPGESAIASYNFTDIASGTGYVTFFGFKDEDSYKLTPISGLYSNRIRTTVTHASPGGADTIAHDLDFDVLFNLTRTLEGELVATIPTMISNSAGSTQNYTVYQKIYVRKWDGSTETEIANDTGESLAIQLNTGVQQELLQTTTVTIPKTNFSAGEYLRITVENHMYNGGATSEYMLGHDPAGRIEDLYALSAAQFPSGSVTVMSFQVPFDVEL